MAVTVAVVVLLVVGAAVVVGSCVGMAVLPDPLDRIHLVTPASTVGVTAICAAVVVRDGVDAAGTAALLTALVTAGASPFVAHATARSITVRRRAAAASAAVDERPAQAGDEQARPAGRPEEAGDHPAPRRHPPDPDPDPGAGGAPRR